MRDQRIRDTSCAMDNLSDHHVHIHNAERQIKRMTHLTN